MSGFLFALTLAAALGSGLVAGVFFAFSTFVMRALARLPPAQGITAMQSINTAVVNPWFLGVFLATAAACGVVAVVAPLLAERSLVQCLLGAALYLAGAFLVTMRANVPLNRALAAVDPASVEARQRWADYHARWTAWNHVRTFAAFAAATALTNALF